MFRLKRFDFYLFLPALFLLGIGVAIIASVSPSRLFNYLIYIIISFIFFLFFALFDFDILFPFSPIIYIGCVLFLILPFFLGITSRGSTRWIPVGEFTIQPSELVKPFLALISAWFWSKGEFTLRKLIFFALAFCPVFILIFLQPDLGSALVTLSMFSGMVVVSGLDFKKILIFFLLGLSILPFFWFSLKDYQRLRIIHFINPYSDPLGEGYNLIQSKIAVGSGGIFGRGLGRGTQSHLFFLPERHTDFIFASLSEELGFLGSSLVLFLYLLFFLRILKIAAKVKEKRLYFLSMSILFYLSFQAIVNLGMNIGILPITGVTLPFVSYGGSSLLSNMISLGLLQAVYQRAEEEKIIEIR